MAWPDSNRSGGGSGDLVGDEALDPCAIVGGDHEEVGGTALGHWDGDGGGVSQVGALGIIAAGKSGMQPVADGVGVGITGGRIGVPR